MIVVHVMMMVIAILVVTGAVLMAVFYPLLIRPQRRTRSLIARGAPTTAVVRSFEGTGVRSNGRNMVRFELEVASPDGVVVPATVRSMCDVTYGPIRTGMVLPVRVDPQDPSMAAIDWAEWTAEPGGDRQR